MRDNSAVPQAQARLAKAKRQLEEAERAGASLMGLKAELRAARAEVAHAKLEALLKAKRGAGDASQRDEADDEEALEFALLVLNDIASGNSKGNGGGKDEESKELLASLALRLLYALTFIVALFLMFSPREVVAAQFPVLKGMTLAHLRTLGSIVYGQGMLLVAAAHSSASAQRKSIMYYLAFLVVNLLVAAATTPTSIAPAAIVHVGIAVVLLGALLWRLDPELHVPGPAVKNVLKHHDE